MSSPEDTVAPARTAWHRRVGVRLVFLMLLASAVSALLLPPAYRLTLRAFDLSVESAGLWSLVPGADVQPETALGPEGAPSADRARTARIVGTLVAWAVIFLAVFGLTSGLVFRAARRVKLLASGVAVPFQGAEDLPGPFDASGDDDLSQLALAMNATRQRAVDMLEQQLQREGAQRDWIAQVSHDLRTPLTALLACIDRARIELDQSELDELRDRMDQLLGVMRIDAERVNTLADDLLEVARIDMHDALVIEPVPPAELLRQAATALQPMAEKAGRTIEASWTPGLPILSADGRRLMRILENLLRNAIQHAETRVVLRATRVGGAVRFEVRDDGPGFPTVDGQVDFEQLASRRNRADSAGLGLIVVRKITQAHGGRIEAFNRPEGGAVVRFHVPAPQGADDDSSNW